MLETALAGLTRGVVVGFMAAQAAMATQAAQAATATQAAQATMATQAAQATQAARSNRVSQTAPNAPRDSSSRPIVLRFAGDILLGGRYEEAWVDSPARSFVSPGLFDSCDVAMANLECPITDRGEKVEKPFNFRASPAFVRGLTSSGVTVVNLANNHIFDYGPQGLFDTISYLDSAGVLHVGAGRNYTAAHRPVIIEVRGIRIGFLGYYGGGEAPAAGDTSPGVARRSIRGLSRDIGQLRERDTVDYVVVNLHWGTEKADEPDPEEVVFGHAAIDAGADAIIGHHPHVLQGIERYRSGVIVYSLGNFIFGGRNLGSYDTAVFEITLAGTSPSFRLIPVHVGDWRASVASGLRGDQIRRHVLELSSGFRRSIFTDMENK